MTDFWCFNNLLETAATPQQCHGNALITKVPEQSKDKFRDQFYDIDHTRSTNIAENCQSTNRRET